MLWLKQIKIIKARSGITTFLRTTSSSSPTHITEPLRHNQKYNGLQRVSLRERKARRGSIIVQRLPKYVTMFVRVGKLTTDFRKVRSERPYFLYKSQTKTRKRSQGCSARVVTTQKVSPHPWRTARTLSQPGHAALAQITLQNFQTQQLYNFLPQKIQNLTTSTK